MRFRRHGRLFVMACVVIGTHAMLWAGNKEMVDKNVDELSALNKQVLEATVPKSALKDGDVIVLKAQVVPARDATGAVRPESVQVLDLRVNDKAMATQTTGPTKLVLPEEKAADKSDSRIKSEAIPIPDGVKK